MNAINFIKSFDACIGHDMATDTKTFRGKKHTNGTVEFPAFQHRGYTVEIWADEHGAFSYFIIEMDSRERSGGASFQDARNRAMSEINSKPPR